MLRLLRALTTEPADAEDALQEAFVAAWGHCGQFKGTASARPWLFSIARHALARRFRRRAEEPAAHDVEPLESLGASAGWGALPDGLDELMTREALLKALQGLSPADREVLLLRDVEGLDSEEAAAVLGIDAAALKSRLHRARLRLAARLKGDDHV